MTSRPASPSALSGRMPWELVAEGYAAENLPMFDAFAREALRLCPARGRVLDLCAGPGSLALQAALAAERVVALDFAPAMLAALGMRATAHVVANIDGVLADGQALPFAEGTFDASYSMFGLMFFPDRARGLRELHRVLRPGASLVLASWPATARVPVFAAIFAALAAERSEPSRAELPPALGTAADCEAELRAAGFSGITVHEHTVVTGRATPAQLWRSFARGGAPIALLRSQLAPDAFAALHDRVAGRLTTQLGAEPIEVSLTALLTLGTRAG